jgi:hypothetical protein
VFSQFRQIYVRTCLRWLSLEHAFL